MKNIWLYPASMRSLLIKESTLRLLPHYSEQDPFTGRTVAQPHPKTVILQNPPALPLGTEELDPYELPYTRKAYPYSKEFPSRPLGGKSNT